MCVQNNLAGLGNETLQCLDWLERFISILANTLSARSVNLLILGILVAAEKYRKHCVAAALLVLA